MRRYQGDDVVCCNINYSKYKANDNSILIGVCHHFRRPQLPLTTTRHRGPNPSGFPRLLYLPSQLRQDLQHQKSHHRGFPLPTSLHVMAGQLPRKLFPLPHSPAPQQRGEDLHHVAAETRRAK